MNPCTPIKSIDYEDAFIAVIKFTDNFTKMTYNGRVYETTTIETYYDYDDRNGY